jgi:hypothetical protein
MDERAGWLPGIGTLVLALIGFALRPVRIGQRSGGDGGRSDGGGGGGD